MAKIILRQASRLGGYARPYVAQILGSHPTYKFERCFLQEEEKVLGGRWTFDLAEDGLYEVCDRNSKGKKCVTWCLLSEGVLQESVADEVAGEWVAALDDRRAIQQAAEAERREQEEAARQLDREARIARDPIANAQAATELAARVARERGIEKDTFLPYVRAALTFWSRIQGRALDEDNTRASFEAMAQQVAFSKEFQRLQGREFDLARDEVFLSEIVALEASDAD